MTCQFVQTHFLAHLHGHVWVTRCTGWLFLFLFLYDSFAHNSAVQYIHLRANYSELQWTDKRKKTKQEVIPDLEWLIHQGCNSTIGRVGGCHCFLSSQWSLLPLPAKLSPVTACPKSLWLFHHWYTWQVLVRWPHLTEKTGRGMENPQFYSHRFIFISVSLCCVIKQFYIDKQRHFAQYWIAVYFWFLSGDKVKQMHSKFTPTSNICGSNVCRFPEGVPVYFTAGKRGSSFLSTLPQWNAEIHVGRVFMHIHLFFSPLWPWESASQTFC